MTLKVQKTDLNRMCRLLNTVSMPALSFGFGVAPAGAVSDPSTKQGVAGSTDTWNKVQVTGEQ